MRVVLFQLIAEQAERLMLNEARAEYVFEVVDPVCRAESPWFPNLRLFVGLVLAAGVLVFLAFLGPAYMIH